MAASVSPGLRVLEADARDDVARVHRVEILAVVRVHAQDAADPLLVAGARVQQLAALVEVAAVDAEVHELADVRVGHDLEGERGEGLTVVGLAVEFFLAFGIDADRWRKVHRRWQEVDDGVEQRLDALVLERRAVEDGHDLVGDRRVAERVAQILARDLFFADVLLEDRVAVVREHVDQKMAVFLGLLLEVVGDLDNIPLRAELFVVPDERLHVEQVDDALVVALGADRQLDHRGRGLETLVDAGEGREEVGAEAVHLVDEADARHAVLVGLTPHGLGLRLDAGDAVEHGDRAVENAQRPLDLDGEVDVAGRVDDVDGVVVPLAGGGGRRDRDAPLLLLGHPVHRGGAFVHLTDLVVLPRVVEDPLGRRGLARVDVGHDPDVAGSVEGSTAHHRVFLVTCKRPDLVGPAGMAGGIPPPE